MTLFQNIGAFFKTNLQNGNLTNICNIVTDASFDLAIADALIHNNNNCNYSSGYPTYPNPIPVSNFDINNLYGYLNQCIDKSNPVNQPLEQLQNKTSLPDEVTNILCSDEFAQTISTTIKDENYRNAVSDILSADSDKIEFANEGKNGGAARYDSKSGKIIINTGTLNNENKDELIKVLIHEAMHAAQKTSFNTQEEELLCESTAIRTRALLILQGKCQDELIYGKTYSELNEMSDEELLEHLKNNFINDQTPGHFGVGPYSNRIIDKSGAVTIHDASGKQIPLASGSKIKIGENEYILGQDVFIEGIGAFAGTTCQIFKIDEKGRPITLGIITFDNMQKLPFEDQVPPIKKHLSELNSQNFETGSIQSGNDNYAFKITGLNPEF